MEVGGLVYMTGRCDERARDVRARRAHVANSTSERDIGAGAEGRVLSGSAL